TESPYGPTFLTADGALDQISGHQILADLVLLRLLEVAGVALMVVATPTLARSLKHDPAHAVLIGAGSPLVLLSLVAGAHNDALMIGLLMAGLAVAKRFGTVPGVILCALAGGARRPVPWLGLGGPRRARAAAHRPYGGRRADRPGHHGSGRSAVRHRLGMDTH